MQRQPKTFSLSENNKIMSSSQILSRASIARTSSKASSSAPSSSKAVHFSRRVLLRTTRPSARSKSNAQNVTTLSNDDTKELVVTTTTTMTTTIDDNNNNNNNNTNMVDIPSSYWVAESQTQFIAETNLPTDKGFYRLRGYRHRGPKTHVITEPTCMIFGQVEGLENVPVRVHDACFTSEVLGSLKCDCKQQLDLALDFIRDNELGVVIYLEQEGRGIGLANKIAAYKVQESGVDTVDANRQLGLPDDIREYSAVRNIIDDLKIKSVALMTNNPRKINELEKEGVRVTSRIPCVTKSNLFSEKYLEAKERRMSHVLSEAWQFVDNAGKVFESKDEADEKGDFSDYSATWDEDDLGNVVGKGIH